MGMPYRSWSRAKRLGQQIARNPETIKAIDALSFREVAEAALHLAAATTGEYDQAIGDGHALAVLLTEVRDLKEQGIL